MCVCGFVVYWLFCAMVVENGEEEDKSEGMFELVKNKKGFLAVMNVVFVDFGWLERLVLGR